MIANKPPLKASSLVPYNGDKAVKFARLNERHVKLNWSFFAISNVQKKRKINSDSFIDVTFLL